MPEERDDLREEHARNLADFRRRVWPVYEAEGFTFVQAYQCFLLNYTGMSIEEDDPWK
jgi:hypothetical protein